MVLREKVGVCELGFVPRRVAHDDVEALVLACKGLGEGHLVVKEVVLLAVGLHLAQGGGLGFGLVEQFIDQVGGFAERFAAGLVALSQQGAPRANEAERP